MTNIYFMRLLLFLLLSKQIKRPKCIRQIMQINTKKSFAYFYPAILFVLGLVYGMRDDSYRTLSLGNITLGKFWGQQNVARQTTTMAMAMATAAAAACVKSTSRILTLH